MKKSRWIVDSGYSRHMTRNHNILTKFKEKDRGNVTFSNNDKSKIIGIGNFEYEKSNMIENILLIDGLKHNLLNVSQYVIKVIRLHLI
jgi:ribosomal protein L1